MSFLYTMSESLIESKSLIDAAWKGERGVGMMRVLVDAGADPNMQDKDGCTALMIASKWGCEHYMHDMEMMRLLVDAGADVNKKNNSGKTAIDLASNDEIKKHLQNIYCTTFARNVLMSGRGPGPAKIRDWEAYIPYDLWREIFAFAV